MNRWLQSLLVLFHQLHVDSPRRTAKSGATPSAEIHEVGLHVVTFSVKLPDQRVVQETCQCDTPARAFSFFFTNDIMDIIIRCTNEEGNRVFSDTWCSMDRIELQVYLRLILLAGVYWARSEPVINLWNRKSGRPVFNNYKSRNCFQILTRVLRFDSCTDREWRR